MRRLLLALLLAALPALPQAQEEAAALVADTLLVTADERLVASGNVQAYFEGTTLSADRITYDRRADRLIVEGPILLRDADGTILAAERAELDPRLEDGLLRGARLVLDRRLQIAANRVDRAGPLTALTGTAATSCQVCPGRAPLWEIQAERILYDEMAELLHLEGARFLVRGVPILWLPRLRLPAPENERASGLLLPRLRASDELGIGIELPFFVVLGPSRDLTLAPLVSPRTLTLGLRYREAFVNGDLELRGALSRDDLRPGEWRGYATAEGAFRLPARTDLAFDISTVSDADYPEDYGLSSSDRIESVVRLARVGESSLLEAELVHTRALDAEDEVPPLQGMASFERRLPLAEGTLRYGTSADGVLRTEGGAETRDLLRAGAWASWERDAVLAYGLVLEGEARAAVDAYRVRDDPAFDESILRAVPAAALTLRWPMVRRDATGAADLLEPVVSAGWAAALGGEPPNEDARLPELDEANLHALSRLPGEDAVEEGGRLSLGLSWTRRTPVAATTLAFGRLFRTDPFEASGATGLGGTASDWLVAGRIELGQGFALGARALLDDDFSPGRTEARLDWSGRGATVEAAYVRLPADAFADRPDRVEELSVGADLRPSGRWTLRSEARYDLARDRPVLLGVGVRWRNECVEVDVSLARRYTSSDETEPSTDLGLSVNLLGFSAGDGPRVEPGACRG